MPPPSPVTVEQLLICEAIRHSSDARPTFRGVIARAIVPRLPFVADSFGLAAELWGPPEARVRVDIVIEGPDGQPVKTDTMGVVPLDEAGTRSLSGAFEGVTFRAEGLHFVVLSVDGHEARRKRFLVDVDAAAAGLGI